MLVFAAGQAKGDKHRHVTWRSGKVGLVRQVKPDTPYEIDETLSSPAPKPTAEGAKPLFEEVSQVLGHTHREEAYDDFARQPLLPRKLSQLGPGVAWWDLNEDGHEDLIIGSGKGGELA